MSCELIRPVHQCDPGSDGAQMEGPVQSGISPAHDHYLFPAEQLGIANTVENTLALQAVAPFRVVLARRNQPQPAREQNCSGGVAALIGDNFNRFLPT